MVKLSKTLAIISFLLYIGSSFVNATSIEENFEDISSVSSKWTIHENGGTVKIDPDNKLRLDANLGNNFPYLTSLFTLDDNTLDIKLEFQFVEPAGNFGDGLVFSTSIPENNSTTQISTGDVVKIWGDKPGSIRIVVYLCGENTSCPNKFIHQLTNPYLPHELRIKYNNGFYQIYIDSELLFTSINSDQIIKYLWMGNYLRTFSNDKWSPILINYFSNNTAPPNNPSPIVLLPGLGASWNLNYILKGVDSGEWKATPYVNVYDDLISTIDQSDEYKLGDNFHVFYYNWTKPVSQIENNFSDFIDNNVLVGDYSKSQVKLIGHSLGGLVAREYWQAGNENKVEKVVTVGSPHRGVVDGYFLWEGGEPLRSNSWEGLGIDFLRVIHLPEYLTASDLIQDLVPVTRDLMPVFDYAYLNGNLVPADSMYYRNSWLSGRNNEFGETDAVSFRQVVGTNLETPISVQLKERSWYDRLVGKWEDGIPDKVVYTSEGDGTVSSKSASLSEVETALAPNSDHVQLMMQESNIKAVLDALGLNTPVVQTANQINRNPALVVLAHSPVTMSVCDPVARCVGAGMPGDIPQASYSPADKLIVIPNSLEGEYKINLRGTGNGEYQLEIGHLKDSGDEWDQITGEIKLAETIQHVVKQSNTGKIETNVQLSTVAENLETARASLLQMKKELPELAANRRFVRLFSRYIDRTIRYIDTSLYQYRKGEIYKASKYARLSDSSLVKMMTYGYKYGEKYKVGSKVILELRNRSEEVLPYLEQAWTDAVIEAGKSYSSRQTNRYYQRTKAKYDTYEAKLSSLTEPKDKYDLNLASYPRLKDAIKGAAQFLDSGENTRAYAKTYNSYLLVKDGEYILK